MLGTGKQFLPCYTYSQDVLDPNIRKHCNFRHLSNIEYYWLGTISTCYRASRENPSKYCVAITMFFRTIPNSNGITILYALTIHDKSMSSQNRNRNRNSDIEFPVSCVQLNREHSHTIVLFNSSIAYQASNILLYIIYIVRTIIPNSNLNVVETAISTSLTQI
jgi:hypothetical protein